MIESSASLYSPSTRVPVPAQTCVSVGSPSVGVPDVISTIADDVVTCVGESGVAELALRQSVQGTEPLVLFPALATVMRTMNGVLIGYE